uniref:Uncharacterized protein n=1 Tax=Oryza sativa subsp. japonica TaxID=39947 RepID=Q6ES28_ORYSJ|nr:hypothetical protein [Oryza sativa Japonica Group]
MGGQAGELALRLASKAATGGKNESLNVVVETCVHGEYHFALASEGIGGRKLLHRDQLDLVDKRRNVTKELVRGGRNTYEKCRLPLYLQNFLNGEIECDPRLHPSSGYVLKLVASP